MRLAVIGATGRTGRQVVEQALVRGDEVIAVARTPENLRVPAHDRLTVARADVRERDELRVAIGSADAIVSALGVGTSRRPTDVYSRGAGRLLEVMDERGIRRLAVVSAAPTGPRAEQPFLQRTIAMPVLERLFGPTYTDMRRMEAILAESGTDWVALRPPRLIDRPATGAYRVDTRPLPHGRAITCGDLATALLDSLGRNDLRRRAAYVAN
jgi:putative NADH-flavin reductase